MFNCYHFNEESESRVFEEGFENESAGSATTIYYNSEDYESKPKRSDDGTVPHNILEFQYPYRVSFYIVKSNQVFFKLIE